MRKTVSVATSSFDVTGVVIGLCNANTHRCLFSDCQAITAKTKLEIVSMSALIPIRQR